MQRFLNYAKNRFLYNLIRFFIIFLIGFLFASCEAKADTYRPDDIPSIQFYDNLNSGLSAITTNITTGGWSTIIPTMVSYGKGAAIGVSSPIALLANHTYTVSITIDGNYGGNIVLSSLNNVGVGTSLSNAVSSYNNNSNVVENYSKVLNDGMTIQFAFTPSINASYFIIPFSISSGGSNYTFTVSSLSIDDLGSSGVSQEDINNSLTNQTNELNQSIQNSTNDINQNINDMEQSIIDSNKETQDVIKDQFNSCRDSVNLYDGVGDRCYAGSTNGIINCNNSNTYQYGFTHRVDVKPNTTYTVKFFGISSNIRIFYSTYDSNGNFISRNQATSSLGTFTFTTNSDTYFVFIWLYDTEYNFPIGGNIQLEEGSVATNFEKYGEEICSNKIDETNDKLDEAEKTRKGILQSIIDLPKSIVNLLLDALKSLFIPEDGYFENWFNDLKMFFETKLGFLATPFTIIIDFVNRYLQLDSKADIIINIPDITVPNFEEYVIIKATSFNWSELLESKEALNTLWQLYLSFIDVYLILNFINLCENKYNRIFGGDTTQYEYYTVEDSVTYDNNTGEVLSRRQNERTTRRKRVE